MAEKLTPQQKAAVEHRGGRLLVSAAAGSGKTKVLVDRLMGYLMDAHQPANMDEFLMITFTKAAAAELRGKIASKLTEHIANDPDNRHLQQQMQRLYLTKISTVHGFCGDILREYAYMLDISGDFRVADENECRQLRTQVLEDVLNTAYENLTESFRAFVDSQGLGRDDRQLADLVLTVYDSARCHISPEGWLADSLAKLSSQDLTDASQNIYGQILMADFFAFLDRQLAALGRCLEAARSLPGCDKPVAVLNQELLQLRSLKDCTTWDDILSHSNLEFKTLTFPQKLKDEPLVDSIKAVRNEAKDQLKKRITVFSQASSQIFQDLDSVHLAMKGLIDLVKAFSKEYDRIKKGRNLMDFGDLEHKMLDLLLGTSRSGLTRAAREVGSRFREVMVDEYQDSNQVQDTIYEALTHHRGNLFMVGDVKQSIYQFRLADPQIFLDKYNSYLPREEASPGEDTKVLLSKNFRSGGGVLAACNDVFQLCMSPQVGGLYYGAGEALYEGIPHTPMGEPETELYCIDVRQETYPEEAAFAARRIQQLLDGSHYVREGEGLRSIQPEDIAILLRSPNSVGRYFQKALENLGIRCATGGGEDLLQKPHITSLHSLLQAIHNPMLDIPLVAVMASPIFGFNADELARIRSKDRNIALYDCVRQDDSPKTIGFLKALLHFRKCLRNHSLTGLLEEIFRLTNLESIYGAMSDGDNRRQDIHSFFELAATFEASGSRDLGRFLEHLEALAEKGLITAGQQTSPGCVSIMSIHKSKGLEFPVVLLCGLSRRFNTEAQRAKVLCHKELGLGLSASDGQLRIHYPTVAKRAIRMEMASDSISEEMRVLYVAMTRARDRLIMTYASDRLQKELTLLVAQLSMGCLDSLVQEASCSGQWVLLTALHRTEAGELFALGGYPPERQLGEPAWYIRVVQAPVAVEAEQEERILPPMPEDAPALLQENLSFRYPYEAATQAASKQTATQQKGRFQDAEAAENTPQPPRDHKARRPGFATIAARGKEYGNAMHLCMQYIDYAACTREAAVEQEVRRLVEHHFLTEEQGKLVNAKKIAAFFRTPLGKKLCRGENVQREFKFSILEDGSIYDQALAGEQVLLQGVVDCALEVEDGIYVVDFKTDHVTEVTLPRVLDRYRPQVQAYARALEKIYKRPVKGALLYFFALDRLEWL